MVKKDMINNTQIEINNISFFLEFIQNKINSFKNYLFKKENITIEKDSENYEQFNKLYDSIIISKEVTEEYLPLIRSTIRKDSLIKEDLYYYISITYQMTTYVLDNLKEYIEYYLCQISLNNKVKFDYLLYQENLNFVIEVLNTFNLMFDLKNKEIYSEIDNNSFNNTFSLLKHDFDELENKFYLEFYKENKENNDFVKELLNMEFVKDEIQ